MAEKITLTEFVTKFFFEGDESGILKFNAALQSLQTVAEGVIGAVQAVWDTLVGSTLELAASVNDVVKQSRILGLSVPVYQALAMSLQEAGASAEDLESAIGPLTEKIAALRSKGEGADVFAAVLGKDPRGRLQNIRSIEEVLPLLADGFSQIQDPIRQAALASELMGDAGMKLLPTLRNGGQALQQLYARVQAQGGISEELAASSEALQSNLSRVGLRLEGLRLIIGAETIPALSELLGAVAEGVTAFRELFGPQIRAGASLLAMGFRTLAVVGRSVTSTLQESARAAAGLKTAMLFVTSAAALMAMSAIPALYATAKAAVITGIQFARAWIVAAAPLLALAALVTGIILIVEDLVRYVQGGESAFGRLLETMREANPVMAGLADMLRVIFGGGLGEAVFDAFDALRSKIQEIWEGLKNTITTELPAAFASAFDAVYANANAIIAGIRDGMLAIPRAFSDAFSAIGGAANAIPNAFAQAGNALVSAVAPSPVAAAGASGGVSVGQIQSSVSVSGAGDPKAVALQVSRMQAQSLKAAVGQAISNAQSPVTY